MAGELTLGELAATIQRAALLIADHTGPLHIASALATPVVNLYSLTYPHRIPWRVLLRVLFHEGSCKYCDQSVCPEQHHTCLRQVSPESVAHAARELLETVEQRRNNVRTLPIVEPWRGRGATSSVRA